MTKMFLTVIRSTSTVRNLSIYLIRISLYFDGKNAYNAKNCNSDLSAEWSQMLFRNSIYVMNINQGTSEFCMPGPALVRFSECHVR